MAELTFDVFKLHKNRDIRDIWCSYIGSMSSLCASFSLVSLKGGFTALAFAALYGHADCIAPLMGAGAKLEANDDVSSCLGLLFLIYR